ncbi:hypothetical protein TNCV_1514491 [Trichonephila clavipes]|nr:hypothetical protein TNCV_1514491 [Trichonephila clavipes]
MGLIAIDEALGSLASLPNGKRFGYCLIVEVQYNTCPIGKVSEEMIFADTLAKAGACSTRGHPAPLNFLEIFSRTKHQNKTAGITPPSTIGISVLVLEALWLTVVQDRIKLF